jgi:zinc protease
MSSALHSAIGSFTLAVAISSAPARMAMALVTFCALCVAMAGGPVAAGEKMTVKKSTMNIQEVESPGGIKAWLVEEHSVPLIAMRFAFAGGNAQDPEDKPGVANFLSSMLDEGAGDLDAAAFQERMEELGVKLSFQDARDTFYGNFQTLTGHRDEAADLLRLALTKPRFDQSAVDRIRAQVMANLAFAEKNPNQVASRAWLAAAFPNHPYGRPSTGTVESVPTIQGLDLEAYRKRVFARDGLKIAVVGDIDAKTLGELLDKVFGGLPEKADLRPIPVVKLDGPARMEVVNLAVPQSVVVFGKQGLKRRDPDFMAAYVMNQILGGGGFSSRLMQEVREKRGLAYGVYSYLQHHDAAEIFAGRVATMNEKVAESLDVIRAELERMAEHGPKAEELADAKSYMTGSYALRFDTSDKIASQLLGIQLDDLGIDYVSERNDLIDALTLDDVKRVAKRLLGAGGLIVTVVGQPKGLATGG